MEARRQIQQQAITLLSRREYSARELQQKLTASHPVEAVDEVLQSLQQQGLQSDERFARVWTRHRLLQGYGPVRVQAELRQKGVDSELIQQSLANEDFDWFEQARQVHQRKFGARRARDAKEKARQMRFLQYRGFTGDQIRHALQGSAEDITE